MRIQAQNQQHALAQWPVVVAAVSDRFDAVLAALDEQLATLDQVGNRTSVVTNGGLAQTTQYDARNRVVGLAYDAAGNLLSDGSQVYTYDGFGRLATARGGKLTTTFGYRGEALVRRTSNTITTRLTHDLALGLPEVLQTNDGWAVSTMVYGRERLATITGSARQWEIQDILGSVRQRLDNTGAPIATQQYDPWGRLTSGSAQPFGFTGEYQDLTTGLVYLRARWYNPAQGTLLGRDPFAGDARLPYSLHPYQYGYSDPVSNTDPTGMRVHGDEQTHQGSQTWEEYLERFRYLGATQQGIDYVKSAGYTVAEAFSWALAYEEFVYRNPDYSYENADNQSRANMFNRWIAYHLEQDPEPTDDAIKRLLDPLNRRMEENDPTLTQDDVLCAGILADTLFGGASLDSGALGLLGADGSGGLPSMGMIPPKFDASKLSDIIDPYLNIPPPLTPEQPCGNSCGIAKIPLPGTHLPPPPQPKHTPLPYPMRVTPYPMRVPRKPWYETLRQPNYFDPLALP